MKQVQIKLYEYDDLSDKAKDKALSQWQSSQAESFSWEWKWGLDDDGLREDVEALGFDLDEIVESKDFVFDLCGINTLVFGGVSPDISVLFADDEMKEAFPLLSRYVSENGGAGIYTVDMRGRDARGGYMHVPMPDLYDIGVYDDDDDAEVWADELAGLKPHVKALADKCAVVIFKHLDSWNNYRDSESCFKEQMEYDEGEGEPWLFRYEGQRFVYDAYGVEVLSITDEVTDEN